MTPTAIVTVRGEERVKRAHPWIYRSDIADVAAAPGDIVEVRNQRQRVLGRAFFSDQSQITLRMMAHGDVAVDDAFWRARLQSAIAFRASLKIDASAYRLVHAEADLIPSFIVDRYGDYLVVQALAQSTDRLLPTLVPILVELTGARGVLARNDPRVAGSKVLSSAWTSFTGTCLSTLWCARDPWNTRSIPGRARRLVSSSISARIVRLRRCTRAAACSTASATTAASRSSWRAMRSESRRSTAPPMRSPRS